MVVLGGWAVGDFCSLLLSWREMDSTVLLGMMGVLEARCCLWPLCGSSTPREGPGSEKQSSQAGLARGSSQARRPHGGSRRRWPLPFSPPAHRSGPGQLQGGWRAAERKQDGHPSPAPISCAFVVFPPRRQDTSPGALPGSNRDAAVTGGRDKPLLQR